MKNLRIRKERKGDKKDRKGGYKKEEREVKRISQGKKWPDD